MVMDRWMSAEGAAAACRAPTCSPRSSAARPGPTRRCSTSRSITPTARSPPCTAPAPTCRREIKACTITQDFDDIPLPTRPIVSVRRDAARPHRHRDHARLSLAVPLLPSTVIKRPLRVRTVETIVQAALESYRNTGYDEISLLSLAPAIIPYFEELVKRMSEVFTPLGVNISLPSLRDQQPAALAAEADEGRPQERPDAGPRGGPRRHARADPQADQQRRPVRGLPRGVPERLAEGEAVFHVRPARRAHRRPRRHHRDGREHRPDRQGGDRPLRRGDGVGVELRPQAAHALPVERHADARVFPLGRRLPAQAASSCGR